MNPLGNLGDAARLAKDTTPASVTVDAASPKAICPFRLASASSPIATDEAPVATAFGPTATALVSDACGPGPIELARKYVPLAVAVFAAASAVAASVRASVAAVWAAPANVSAGVELVLAVVASA